jgi:hypothetical protein
MTSRKDKTDMASTQDTPELNAPASPEKAAETVVAPPRGDRVAMLSLKSDGTPDQVNPTFVVDRETALRATTAQLSVQAVAAADTVDRPTGPQTIVGTPGDEPDKVIPASEAQQDPSIQARVDAHQAAQEAAVAAAEATVDALLPKE